MTINQKHMVRKYMVKKARLAEQKMERARIDHQLRRSQVQERLDRLNEYRREQLKNVRPKIETYCGPERTPMQSYSNNSIFGNQYHFFSVSLLPDVFSFFIDQNHV
jgi:hypothetical protein